MPRSYINSVVLVGREFDVSLFDERELTPTLGSLDRNSFRAGPVGNYAYSNGHYGFHITPDRIDIRHVGQAILPGVLTIASEIVIEQLAHLRPFVTAVGINCDAVFTPQEIGKLGKDFCQALMVGEAFQQIHDGNPNASVLSITTTFPDDTGLVQNTVRIESEPTSGHQDLVVAFNGHQIVTVKDDLNDKLKVIDKMRDLVICTHNQIRSLGK